MNMQLHIHVHANYTLWVVWSLPIRSLTESNGGGAEAKGYEYHKTKP